MSRAQALNKLLLVVSLLFFLLVSLQLQASPLHYQMQVELVPALKMLKAETTLTFPKGATRKTSFLIQKNFQVSVTSPGDQLVLINNGRGDDYAEYGVTLANNDNKVTLQYHGVVYDPVVNNSSRGLISPDGATLFGSSYWYPRFLKQMSVFNISVKVPQAWTPLIQGQLLSTSLEGPSKVSRFTEIYPQDDIYLVAGPFSSYEKRLPDGKVLKVLLRKNEPQLAETFLNVMPGYFDHYTQELGPYPYSQFTVVENFWETGYGMPSFTLLGPSVIRLPFILNSSLPHEILHNWWGNSVYVDTEHGNWCEGLTTYMADYWQQSLNGADRRYRMGTLMGYQDFVTSSPDKDFPLVDFKERHNASSQAIGYGKSMMLFHMLENRVGSEVFKKSLQNFYAENLFKAASFRDIQKSFEKVSGSSLDLFFNQWLERKGAPKIALDEIRVAPPVDGTYITTYSLSQSAPVYDLRIPVKWTLANGEIVRQSLAVSEKSQVFSFMSRVRPVELSIDEDFQIFRHLYTEERPATLSSVLGNANVHFYYDHNRQTSLLFSQRWAQAIDGKAHFHEISELQTPPSKGALVLVGDEQVFRDFMLSQLSGQNFSVSETQISIEGQVFDFSESSTVVVARLTGESEQTVVWVRWSQDNNPVEWAQRLTHYGSFGILAFKGRPAVLKSTWPVLSSPLKRHL